MKPKWVEKASGKPIHNIDFYIPDEEYQIALKARGKLSWREFILQAAKDKLRYSPKEVLARSKVALAKCKAHSQRSNKGKGDT